MKRIFIIFLIATVTVSFSHTVLAHQPIEGDIVDYWGQLEESKGDSLIETDDGVRLTFGRAMWAARTGTLDKFKLDGLKVKLKDVEISDGNAIAFGIGNTEGGWVDSKGIFFMHFTKGVSEALGDTPNGYVIARQGLDIAGVNPKIITDTPHTKKPVGDLTFQFIRNSDGSWTYTFNGQNFSLTKEIMDEHIENQKKVFLYFGNWGTSRGAIAYTIADISILNVITSAASSLSTSKSSEVRQSSVVSKESTDNESSDLPQEKSEDDLTSEESSPQSIGGTSADNSDTVSSDETAVSTNTIKTLVIIIVLLALVSAVLSGTLLVKKKKMRK